MNARAIWTPEALDDLEKIVEFIATKDGRPLVAENIAQEIHAACDRYANHPLLGQLETRVSINCRRFVHKRWVVLYRPVDHGIAILRIVDGARDFNRLFETS